MGLRRIENNYFGDARVRRARFIREKRVFGVAEKQVFRFFGNNFFLIAFAEKWSK